MSRAGVVASEMFPSLDPFLFETDLVGTSFFGSAFAATFFLAGGLEFFLLTAGFLAVGFDLRGAGLGFGAGFLALLDEALAGFFLALVAIEEMCSRICLCRR